MGQPSVPTNPASAYNVNGLAESLVGGVSSWRRYRLSSLLLRFLLCTPSVPFPHLQVLVAQGLGKYCDVDFVGSATREMQEALDMTQEEMNLAAHQILSKI